MTVFSIIGEFLEKPRSIKGAAANCIISAALLIYLYFASRNVSLVPDSDKPYIIVWIVVTLFFAARLLLRKRIITPEVVNPICPYCSTTLETHRFWCPTCNREI